MNSTSSAIYQLQCVCVCQIQLQPAINWFTVKPGKAVTLIWMLLYIQTQILLNLVQMVLMIPVMALRLR